MKTINAISLCAAFAASAAAFAAAPTDDATDSGFVVKDIDGDGVIRVACVGDSITAGTGEYNYPKFLGGYLKELGKVDGKKYAVRNHGKGGAAVRHVRQKVDVNGDGVKDDYFYYDDRSYLSALEYTPDVVIIQMGTNDSVFNNWDNWNSYFERDYEEFLVKPFREKGSLIVVSTPPFACNGLHDRNVNGPVHERVVKLARRLGLKVVDTNRLLYGQKDIFADGLHCNRTGYSLMAQNFYRIIFGGKLQAIAFRGEAGTRVTITDKASGQAMCRVLDKDGKGSLTILPEKREFRMRAEKNGYKTVMKDIAVAKDGQTVSIQQKPGDFNRAMAARPIQCDAKVYGGDHNADTLNDSHRTSGGYQPASFREGDWCGLELRESEKIHTAVIYWETAAFVSTIQDGGYDLLFKIGGEWKSIPGVKVTREPYSGDVVADVAVLPKPMSVLGVKVVFRSGKCSHQYAPKVYEIELLSDVKPPKRNPIIEGWYADPQIRRYGSTYWLFPTYSHDYGEQTFLDVFSSKDLKSWKKHPKALDGKDFSWVRGAVWAPDAHEKDGKYYIFFGANDTYPRDLGKGDLTPKDKPAIGGYGGIGVGVADRPEGPYRDLIGKPLIDQFWNRAQPIDQYVFQYKGEWYMVYGGWGKCNLVKLAPDFKSLLPLDDKGTMWKDMTPKGYVEGSVMFERKGKWYFMYSAGAWTQDNYCVNYSVADTPFGPFEFKGKVLGIQRPIATGAGHHSVINIPGTDDWYICYHRRPIPNEGGNHRVTCLDRMYFDANGDIEPIRMTE